MDGHVIIAGASLGGLRAAEQLRRAGWDGDITVVGAETHMPYNRPPLSKDALRGLAAGGGVADAGRQMAAASAFPIRLLQDRLTWRLASRIASARLDEQTVQLDDGTSLHYDGLVVATGLRPRRLPLPGGERGRHVLRTVDDAANLRHALSPGSRVVVVGGGFIGCEVAASTRQLGCQVTVVEPLPAPMLRPLGPDLAAAVRAHHERRGVRFGLGRSVSAIVEAEDGTLRGVELDDGRSLPCDVLVEAIGSHPNVEWLEGNQLDLTDGVLCDDRMRVEGRADVVAVGDVARYPSPFLNGGVLRNEHWCVPTDTARRAGPTLVAHLTGAALEDLAAPSLPTFWSDQFELRIQGLGAPGLANDHTVLQGSLDDLDGGVAVGALHDDVLVGVVAVGLSPIALRPYREPLTARLADPAVASPAV
jgi:3-phenylpropionate/trans-cinnamate dioxygenase ferredoxin reductase subunit